MALKIKLVKSLNGRGDKQIATAHSLGLHKIGNETTQPDQCRYKGQDRQDQPSGRGNRSITKGGAGKMKLHELSPAPGSVKKAFRKGRGSGSGNGKTAGKGHKGQNARSGRPCKTGL